MSRPKIKWKDTPDTLLCWLLILQILWLVQLPAQSQTKFQSLHTKGHSIQFRLWTKEDGLPHWKISGGLQDSRGYIWMQNQQYLTRFDGNSFMVADTLDAWGDLVSAFFAEDLRGNIWRYYWHDEQPHIEIFDPFSFKTWSFQEYTGLEEPFGADHPASMLLYSVDRVVYLFSRQRQKLWRYEDSWELVLEDRYPASGRGAYFIYPGPDDAFWCVEDGVEIRLVDANGAILRRFPGIPATGHRFLFAKDQIYTYSTDPESPHFLQARALLNGAHCPASSLNSAPAWFPLSHHWSWLAQVAKEEFTFYWVNLKKQMLYSHQDNAPIDLLAEIGNVLGKDLVFSPNFSSATNLMFNPSLGQGNVCFIPLQNHGFLQIITNSNKFTKAGEAFSIRDLCLVDGQKLLATSALSRPVLYEVDLKTNLFRKTPMQFAPYSVTTHKGRIWTTNHQGIFQYINGQYRLFSERPDSGPKRILGTWEVRRPKAVSDSIVWYCSDVDVIELNLNTRQSRFVFKGGDKSAFWLHQDQKGDLWVATSAGLYHFASGNTYLDSLNGKPLRIHHIFESADGHFWLSTFQGLIKWKPFSEQFEQFDASDGLAGNELHAAYPDRIGRLWLSSNHGIIAFDTTDHTVQNFTTRDGLANNEQNFHAHLQGPDGRLYFGGIAGITIFNPNDIPKRDWRESYGLHIDRILQYAADGSALPVLHANLQEPMQIERSCIQTSIILSQPYYGQVRPVFEWRIPNQSPDWTPFDISQPLSISGIPHGPYELEIRALDPTRAQEFETWRYSFFKAYYLYQRGWFQALLALLFLGGIILTFRRRTVAMRAQNKKLEEMVVARTEIIKQQKDELEKLDQAKNQLFNNISHEFRTPLNLIQGYAERLLPSNGRLPDIETAAGRILTQTGLLKSMIEEIMDLSRLDLGMVRAEPAPIAWNTYIGRIFGMLESLAVKKQQDYQLEVIPEGEETILFTDVKKMERILVNLIGNAIKFTPQAGRILVRSEITDGEVIVVVTDTGPGIEPKEQKTIFERHRQGSAARGHAQPGYGIGLAMCREYALLMDARLWVESLPGKGASFFLTFPLRKASSKDLEKFYPKASVKLQGHKPRSYMDLAKKGEKSHILVVEDNTDFRKFFQDALEQEHRVSVATNGQEAYAMLEADTTIDLVVSDVLMPVMDGFTLLQQTRLHPRLGYLPFILITAMAEEEGRLHALRLGVDAFLTKPFSLVELTTVISSLLRNQERRKAYIKEGALPKAAGENRFINNLALTNEAGADQELEPYSEQWMQELEAAVMAGMHRPNFKVPDLAFQLNISERTLRNRIREYTGMSPSEYLQKARLDQAMRFLKGKKYKTISEVAYASGFSDPKYFTQIFKNVFGKLPSDYL